MSTATFSEPVSRIEADENNEILHLLTWLQENIPLAFAAIAEWAATGSLPKGVFSEACREYGAQMRKEAPNIRALARVATRRITQKESGVYVFDATPYVAQ